MPRIWLVIFSLFNLVTLNPVSASFKLPSYPQEEIVLSCVIPSQQSTAQAKANAHIFNDDLLSAEQAQETVLMRENGEQDGRKRILNTADFPYSAHVYFTAQFPEDEKNKVRRIGSGVFIGPQVILTAAHVVFSKTAGGFFQSLCCWPAANDQLEPFGTARVVGVKVSPFYLEDNKIARYADYAVVFIDRPLGLMTGQLGIAIVSDDKLDQLKKGLPLINIFGYPGDKIKTLTHPQLWGMQGKIQHHSDDDLHYQLDTAPGQSGSAIWYETPATQTMPKAYYVIGVHAYGADKDYNYNYGPRLTRDKFNHIATWINEFNAQTISYDNLSYIPSSISPVTLSSPLSGRVSLSSSLPLTLSVSSNSPKLAASSPDLPITTASFVPSPSLSQLQSRPLSSILISVPAPQPVKGTPMRLDDQSLSYYTLDATLTALKVHQQQIKINQLRDQGVTLDQDTLFTQLESPQNIFLRIANNLHGPTLDYKSKSFNSADHWLLLSALEYTKSIRILYLNDTLFDDKSFDVLCQALMRNTSLHELHLQGATFPAKAMTQLATSLNNQISLQYLDLRFKSSQPQGNVTLTKADIETFYSLTTANQALRLILWPEKLDSVHNQFLTSLFWAEDLNPAAVIKQLSQTHLNALFHLGCYLKEGIFMVQDQQQVIDCLMQAQLKGHPFAAYELTKLHEEQGDYYNALLGYLHGAHLKHAPSQFMLGEYYRGVWPKNDQKQPEYSKAIHSYFQAAQQSYAPALHRIGRMYEFGKGIERSHKLAATYYLYAIQQGYADAFTAYGALLLDENSEIYDPHKGIDYLKRALNFGVTEFTAQRILAHHNQSQGLSLSQSIH